MAINPELITTIRVDQLPDGTLNLTNKIPHTSGTVLEKASVQDLVDLVATAIGVSGGVGYIALSVTDGQQLPDVPELPSFFLCGAGTFLNINGYPDIICTENLNAIMSLTDHWELAVEIPINPLSGTVQSVTGSAVDNTDPLNPVINSTGGATPTLQEVTDEGNITTNPIIFDDSLGLQTEIGTMNGGSGFYFKLLNIGNNFKQFLANADNTDERIANFPDKSGTIAFLDDITTPTLQDVTDEGNTTTNDVKVNSLGLYSNSAADYGYLSWEDDLGLSFKNHTTQEVFKADKVASSLSFVNNDDFTAKLDATLLTDNRTFLLPDADGTIALTSDIPTGGGGIPHATASGTDTYTATITGVAAYADGDAYLIRFTNGNTTSATLNINSLGDITLYRNNDGVLIGGDIISGGEMICVYNSVTTSFQVIGTSPNSLFAYVTNADSVTLTKGMPVYAFSGTGDRMTVKRAYNTLDATSAQTVGLVLSTSIAANQKGLIMMQGLLDGLSILPTSTWADGDPVYLGATAGTITNVKPYAPNHLVYLGVVTTANNGSAGRMYVRVQNGYELDEIHDVDLISNAPTNNQALIYESSTDLWKNKTIIQDSITDGVTTVAPSQNAVFDALALKFDSSSYNWMLSQGYGLLGSSIKGVNLTCPTFASLTATSLGTGVGRYLSYYLPQAATITGVKFFQPNQGVYTGNNYNGVGLYSYSGGTLTLVASTTNDTEFWKGTSATWITKPFSSTYSASAGVYYLFALYNSSAQTTAPTILFNAYNANNFPTIDFTNSAKLGGTSNSGTTALPTPTVATTSINAATAGSGLILLY